MGSVEEPCRASAAKLGLAKLLEAKMMRGKIVGRGLWRPAITMSHTFDVACHGEKERTRGRFFGVSMNFQGLPLAIASCETSSYAGLRGKAVVLFGPTAARSPDVRTGSQAAESRAAAATASVLSRETKWLQRHIQASAKHLCQEQVRASDRVWRE